MSGIELTPFLQLLLTLAVILIAAKGAGYLSILAHQPSVLGELMIGLLLGPSVLDLLHLSFLDGQALEKTIHELSEIGVLMLMFVAGLELHLSDLARNVKVSALAGTLGVILPVSLGWGIGLSYGFSQQESIFLGLTLGATSVSISAQTLMELKVLRSRVGIGLLGSAVFDDVLVILITSGFLAFAEGSSGLSVIGSVFFRMLLFLVLSVSFGWWLLPWITRKVARLPISQGVLALAIVVMFSFGLAAEVVGGMAAITGTFLAGLMFARSPEKERLERGIHALSYGFFVPIFFVTIGLTVNIRGLKAEDLWLLVIITVTAVVGKMAGAGLGARIAGFPWLESAQLGGGMISRGEVGLILATIGVGSQIMTNAQFTLAVGMVLITTLITPPLLRYLFTGLKTKSHVTQVEE